MRFLSLLAFSVLALAFLASIAEAAGCNCPSVQMCDNNGYCQQCQGGYISSGGSSTQCTICPANTFARDGSSSCSPCPAGSGSSPGSRECQQCQDGMYAPAGKGCMACPSGYISQRGASSCSPCGPGTFSNSAGTYCQECSAGEFQDQSGQATCQKCPKGYFTGSGKSASCTICPCGTFNDREGATNCDTCGNQTPASDPGADSRSKCFVPPAGYTLDSHNCAAQCPAGTFSSQSGSTTCATCPGTSVAQPGSSSCHTCSIGSAPDATRATCTPTSTKQVGKRAMMPFCRQGHKACRIPGKKGIFECVDIGSDLTSCGGCADEGEGVDCTAFDKMASAQCVRGKCQYECPKGYTLTPLGCQRITRRVL